MSKLRNDRNRLQDAVALITIEDLTMKLAVAQARVDELEHEMRTHVAQLDIGLARMTANWKAASAAARRKCQKAVALEKQLAAMKGAPPATTATPPAE